MLVPGREPRKPVSRGRDRNALKGDPWPSDDSGSLLLTTFGSSLRTARVAMGLSQYQLADAANVNRSSITAIEAGRQNLTFETAEKLANAVGRPLLVMLGMAIDQQVLGGGTVLPQRDHLAIELTESEALVLARIGTQTLGRDIILVNPVTRQVVIRVFPAVRH